MTQITFPEQPDKETHVCKMKDAGDYYDITCPQCQFHAVMNKDGHYKTLQSNDDPTIRHQGSYVGGVLKTFEGSLN